MTIDYFLVALDKPDFELKIRESESKNLPYTRFLRLDMIRKKEQKRELVEEVSDKHGTYTRALEVDAS